MYRVDDLLLIEHLTYRPDVPPLHSILEAGEMTVGEYLDTIDPDALEDDVFYCTQMNGIDFRNIILAIRRNPAILEARIMEPHLDQAYGSGGWISAVQLAMEIAPDVAALRWVTRRPPVWLEREFTQEAGSAADATESAAADTRKAVKKAEESVREDEDAERSIDDADAIEEPGHGEHRKQPAADI